jgi:hypothetical protein
MSYNYIKIGGKYEFGIYNIDQVKSIKISRAEKHERIIIIFGCKNRINLYPITRYNTYIPQDIDHNPLFVDPELWKDMCSNLKIGDYDDFWRVVKLAL